MNQIRLTHLKCKICAWEWIPRRPVLPSRCPKCYSVKWNRDPTAPRKRKAAKKTTTPKR